MTSIIHAGDCRDVLRTLPERSVQTVITSPPYFGLRDYGTGEWEGGDAACDHRMPTRHQQRGATSQRHGRSNEEAQRNENFRDVCGRCGARRVDRQIGLEPSPDEFVAAFVQVFREVRRVLRDDGTVWINLGDSYCSTDKWGGGKSGNTGKHTVDGDDVPSWAVRARKPPMPGVKPKDLIGVPWMVAFALRADGWYLRSDVVWSKPNPMPESVTDRPTRSHEYIFMLAKQARYYFDQDAIREENSASTLAAHDGSRTEATGSSPDRNDSVPDFSGRMHCGWNPAGRNKRSVWTVATQPFSSERLGLGETEHFAVFPPKLIEPCVLAGSAARACGVCGAPWRRVVERTPMVVRPSERASVQGDDVNDRRTATSGTMTEAPTSRTVGWEPSCAHDDDTGRSVVLDPFAGSGAVGVVCGWHGRDFIGIELNPRYARMARERIALEGRPGGRPASHEPARVNGHPSLFDP